MKWIIIITLLAILSQGCSSKASEKKKLITSDVVSVKLVSIKQIQASDKIHVSGLLTTANESKLSFKIPGIIESINVADGDFVKKGQLLASLKSTEITAQVSQAKSGLEKAERDFQRMQNLFSDSVATLEQLQNARTALEISKQQLQQIMFNEKFSRIYAPCDGFISRKYANEGELAGAGSPIITMNGLQSPKGWLLKAGVRDRDWSTIKTGNKATVLLDAFSGQQIPGTVTRKSQASDPAGGSFEIEIQLDVINQNPAVGMYGEAVVFTESSTTGFLIPYESLLEANGTTGYVFVTNDKRSVKRIQIEIAKINKDNVLVTKGLEGYTHLVTSGSPFLSERSIILAKN